MCGIHGILNFKREKLDYDKFLSGLCSIQHRGPDDFGFVLINTISKEQKQKESIMTDKNAKLCQPNLHLNVSGNFDLVLGQCRFAINDLSVAGHQPMFNEDGSICIIFNGEILNYKELRKELSMTHKFKSESDTEVIIHGYEEWGIDALCQRMTGFWAFAIYDSHQNKLICSRDRFGLKPFFYHLNDTNFIFGSEIKAIFPWIDITLNEDRISQYFTFKYPDPTSTFYNEIKMLAPSANLFIDLKTGQSEIIEYWNIQNKNLEYSKFNADELAPILLKHFEQSLRENMPSDAPVGITLSGGIDSTFILGYLRKMIESKKLDPDTDYNIVKLNIYSMIPEGKDRSEKPEIEQALKFNNVEANLIHVKFSDYLDNFDTFISYCDEPVDDNSIFLNYLMYTHIKKDNIKVVLNGMGADEIFGGYRPHIIQYVKDLLKRRKLFKLIKETFKLRSFIYPYIWKFIRRITGAKAKAHAKIINVHEVPPYAPPYSVKNLADLLNFDLIGGASYRLHKGYDQASMICPVETRSPFLYHPMVEWAFSLPLSTKIFNGYPKFLLRYASKSYIPESIRLLKEKIGFPSSEKSWAINMLKDRQEDLIALHPYLEPYINTKELPNFYKRILKKELEEDIQLLWKLIIFGTWMKKMKERKIIK